MQRTSSTVLDLMTRLADKSLVTIERLAGGTSRYRMLEMSRQFAQEKLDEAGEGDAARARHLKYFVAWSEEREAMAEGAKQGDWTRAGDARTREPAARARVERAR